MENPSNFENSDKKKESHQLTKTIVSVENEQKFINKKNQNEIISENFNVTKKQIQDNNNSESLNASKNKMDMKLNEIKIINKNTGEITFIDDSKANSFLDNEMKNIFIPKNRFTKPWDDFWSSHKKERTQLLSFILQKDFKSIEREFSINDQELIREYLNYKYTDDLTLLHFSCILSDTSSAELLLKKGANPNALSKTKRTPLHLSSIFNCFEVSKILLKYNADINAVDVENNSSLHFISENGFEELLHFFLNKNADMCIRNNAGKTALDLSANQTISQIIQKKLDEKKSELISDKYDERNYFVKSIVCNIYKERPYYYNYLNYNSANESPSLLTSGESQNIHTIQIPKLDKFAQLKKFAKIKLKEQLLNQYAQNESSSKNSSTMNSPTPSNNQDSTLKKSPILYLDLNSYSILAKIGSGAFGVVFLVECKIDKERYALKLIKKEHIFSHNIIKYMKAEQNVLASSRNPFIVEMKCSFQDKNFLYLVMEYCPGGNMLKLFNRSPNYRLEEEVARKYLAQILLAIKYLHSKDTIYRDLKPDNIVFDLNGNAKIVDFGLSKEGITGQNVTDTFLGTENYLAPEMISKKGHGKALDWYMFGVLAFEMLTGRVPFLQKRESDFVKKIGDNNLQFPRFLSNEAIELLQGLLLRDPTKRLGSGNKDAEEIMQSKFFRSINWDDVMNLKMEMPKPLIIKYKEKVMNLKDCIRISSKKFDNVQNFTFIDYENTE